MKIIGITGGIGSGKTFVLNTFREKYNIPIYDADKEVSKILDIPAIQTEIFINFGIDSYLDDGTFNKDKFRKLFAENEYAVKLMNSIMYPAFRRDMRQWILTPKNDITYQYALIEYAMLFESKLDDLCTDVITVTAPYQLRIERLIKRGVNLRMIDTMMKVQYKDEQKIELANYNITNIHKEETIQQIDIIHEQILKLNEKT